MPNVLELREIDGEIWARVDVPGDFLSGVALWTPDEQTNHRNRAIEDAACQLDEYADGTHYGQGAAVNDIYRNAAKIVRALINQ